jgi:hypothetical protein
MPPLGGNSSAAHRDVLGIPPGPFADRLQPLRYQVIIEPLMIALRVRMAHV